MTAPELVEETPGRKPDWQRYADIVRRRHLAFFLIVLSSWIAVWSASWFLPATYKSSTLILVEQPTMPKNYVPPNITDNLQDRLQSITQQILSRTRLLAIIDKWHLYGSAHRRLTPDAKVQMMRKDIAIDLVKDEREDTISAFTVAYSASSPAVAQEVTTELTKLFIDDNSRMREQESEQTTQFLTNQLESARRDLEAQAAKVRAFEDQHQGALPTQEASNLQILSGLQSQLQNEQDALNNAKQQRVYFESLIQQYQALHGTGPDSDVESLETIDQNLAKMKDKLAALSVRYTDDYPDVQDLKRQIASAEASRAAMLSAEQSSAGRAAAGRAARRAGLTSTSQEMLQLESQLSANSAEIANRQHAISALLSRINDYQSRLNTEPLVQQNLSDLTQGYEQSRKNFDELLTKAKDSQMATSMEQLQEGERFMVLDPPSLPIKPDFPNRLKLSGLGAGLGIALGLAFAGLMEFLDDRLHDRSEIQQLLPAPILSDIPTIATARDERRLRFITTLGWCTSVSTTLLILAGSVFSYLHP